MLFRAVCWFLVLLPIAPRGAATRDNDTSGEASAWQKLPAGPKARYALQMVWDSHKKRVLLFGGESNPEFKIFDDLWAYSPAKSAWTELKPQGEKPAKRCYGATCFDTKRKGMWLHGGFNPTFLDDLWFFDSDKETWRQVVVKGDKPSPRDGHALHYNPQTDELILFGGLLDFTKFEVNDELWIFNIDKQTWSRRKTGPSARLLACSALDAKHQRLYVNGGFGKGGQGVSGEMWTYDIAGDAWTQAKDDGPNLGSGGMVCVPGLNRLFLFGGADTNRDIWYDLKSEKWYVADKAAPPPARSYCALCLDTEGKRVYLLGGTTGGFTGPNVPADLWVRKLPAAPRNAP
jgi:N-acetylneuraminic acid mutarotase